jgi:hypothetical protein
LCAFAVNFKFFVESLFCKTVHHGGQGCHRGRIAHFMFCLVTEKYNQKTYLDYLADKVRKMALREGMGKLFIVLCDINSPQCASK